MAPPLPERLTVTVDADVALAEIRALAEEYRQIVADLRELRGKPAVGDELAELARQAHETAADIATLRGHVIATTESEYLRNKLTRPSDPHGALDRWRSLRTEPAPMDGTPVLLGSFTGDGALVWAWAAQWPRLRTDGRNGWCGLLPHGQRPLDLSDYPPTHWRPI